MEKPTLVIGHRNPDTDSVCSAICYARLKTLITGHRYEAKRAGHLNEETAYILNKFNITPPEYLKDVRPQVSDVDIHINPGVDKSMSVKRAYSLMKERNVVSLPVLDKDEFAGIITINDISKSYFEVYDSRILALAHTSFSNLVETLEGDLLTGDINQTIDDGKVLVAAGSPDIIEHYLEDNDIVILGNRFENQLFAIEMNARCLVVCDGAEVSNAILARAAERNCSIIVTKHDTYTVSRIITQSLPISYYMTPKEKIISFKPTDFIEDIQDIMAKKRFRDFPVIDSNGTYYGTISRRNLIKHGRKKLILVDHNESSQAVAGVNDAEIVEIIDHHRIGSIQTISPVYFRNQPLGCTASIIYQMYKEYNLVPEKDIAILLCSAIISDTLILKSPTCTPFDIDACHNLAEIADIDIEEYGREIFKAGSNLISKTPKEIFNLDFKRFTINDTSIGIGQVNCMTVEESDNLKAYLKDYTNTAADDNHSDMVFLLITNVLEESSDVICSGRNALQTIENAFNINSSNGNIRIKGLVSRKKQFLPAIMEVLQQ